MNISQFQKSIELLFGELLESFKDQCEFGFNHQITRPIIKLGYSTNLTPEVVEQAKVNGIDLIITHHDAWDFVYGMKDECVKKMQEYEIAHFFVHLPLDYAEFGTCNTLLREIGDVSILQQSRHVNGDSIIGAGQLTIPISFTELVARLENALAEKVKAWQFGENNITRIGMLTGAGNGTKHIWDAKQLSCDVYITGESSLYTVQYAKFAGMNLIVGSHTFTEIFGVRSLAYKLKEAFPQIEIVYLEEEHLETCSRAGGV